MAESKVVDVATVQRVARLARLQLDDGESQALAHDLAAIVSYIDQLAEANTTDVAPMIHTTIDQTPLRPDRAEAALGTETALANAPQAADGHFVVPQVVGS